MLFNIQTLEKRKYEIEIPKAFCCVKFRNYKFLNVPYKTRISFKIPLLKIGNVTKTSNRIRDFG